MTSQHDKLQERDGGSICHAVTIIGDKWTARIIKEIDGGVTRFCQIEDNLSGISPRTLSQRLDFMTEQGIITRQNFSEMPPRVEYTLTQKGKDLLPILDSMSEWGAKHSTITTGQ